MEQIKTYFNAERSESVLFIITGIVAILVSIYFLAIVKKEFNNGMSYALIAIALIQLVVGSTVYLRSNHDIERVTSYYKTEKNKIATEEIPRMTAVMKSFVVYRYIELALMMAGVAMMFCFANPLVKGIGVGLLLQATLMLVFDFFAEKRGHEYMAFLQSI